MIAEPGVEDAGSWVVKENEPIPPGPRQFEVERPLADVLGDQVVAIGGREAVALGEQAALGVQEREPRPGAVGVGLGDQQLAGGGVDLEEVGFARRDDAAGGAGDRPGSGKLGGGRDDRAGRQERAVFEPLEGPDVTGPGSAGRLVGLGSKRGDPGVHVSASVQFGISGIGLLDDLRMVIGAQELAGRTASSSGLKGTGRAWPSGRGRDASGVLPSRRRVPTISRQNDSRRSAGVFSRARASSSAARDS